MFKNLLVPVSGESITKKKLNMAIKLAKLDGAKISLVYISDPVIPYSSSEVQSALALSAKEYKKVSAEFAKRVLAKARAVIGPDVNVQELHIYHPNISDGILEAAKKAKADVIVMASHKRTGLRGIFLRSEAQEVILHSKLPVLILG
ncbi:universal stress protein [Polynucleobacter sp. MG-27-Goln-C1]|uniref:universal stress protein n=1 Tax=Polynucleobacter sp. MG-27-Goln-C1 TaxID=1819726 RepID=UPI001C0D137B|nr:universal stress protein [Polynucleobacter sp. MG-27-Goln-C1]MBU3613240.1 universal stress protein [Polynucleobacter sp. MG-27-Goln-C1]